MLARTACGRANETVVGRISSTPLHEKRCSNAGYMYLCLRSSSPWATFGELLVGTVKSGAVDDYTYRL